MPEVTVRKRVARRSGGVGFRLQRWRYRHRPQLAVAVAFLAACAIGLGVSAYRALKPPPRAPEVYDVAPETY